MDSEYVQGPAVLQEELCPCGRMMKLAATWLCTLCYVQKEIGYALSELERGGEAWPGHTWHDAGLERLQKLAGMQRPGQSLHQAWRDSTLRRLTCGPARVTAQASWTGPGGYGRSIPALAAVPTLTP